MVCGFSMIGVGQFLPTNEKEGFREGSLIHQPETCKFQPDPGPETSALRGGGEGEECRSPQ